LLGIRHSNSRSRKRIRMVRTSTTIIFYIKRAMRMDASQLGEPVVCSKCNLLFDTDLDFVEHYDQNHKREN